MLGGGHSLPSRVATCASRSYALLMVTKDVRRAAENRIRQLRAMAAGPRGGRVAGAVLVCCAVVAGCGGSRSAASTRQRHLSAAARVCGGAQRAARPVIGSGVRLRIADSNATDIECVL